MDHKLGTKGTKKLMTVTEMKRDKEVIIHRVRNGDGVFISPVGTTVTHRENHDIYLYACKHCAKEVGEICVECILGKQLFVLFTCL